MVFNYMEVPVYHSCTRPRGVLQRFRWRKALRMGIRSLLIQKSGKYLYQFCARPFEELEGEENQGFSNFTYIIVTVFYHL